LLETALFSIGNRETAMSIHAEISKMQGRSAEINRLVNKKRKKILIVDRDLTFRRSLFKVLFREGYSVFTAANLTEALEFLSQVRFSLILMDMYRPHEGGLERLERLLRAARGTRIIVMTTFSEATIQDEVCEMGADRVLVKPLKREAILEAVLEMIQKTK